MLALDDAALARVMIAATAVAPSAREAWLMKFVERAEGQPPAGRTSAARQRRARQRAKDGRAILRLEVDEHLIVSALLDSTRLTEAQALDRRLVERECRDILHEWARIWTRDRRSA
jgi:hypothetical protein